MSIGLFYGSSTGNTETVAEQIAEALGGDVDVIDIASADADKINGYEKLILGSSTWGEGDYQDDWDGFNFSDIKFSGKTVALFGLGDANGYPDSFVDAVGLLYEEAKNGGAKIVGEWEKDDYEFDESKALNSDGKFVGLALDNDNQEDLTEERIKKWVEIIKPDFQ